MTTVTKGRIVLVTIREMGKPKLYNGADEHPAIVTAVHSGGFVNARVFVDGGENPLWLTSVPHRDDAGEGYGGSIWRWPTEA